MGNRVAENQSGIYPAYEVFYIECVLSAMEWAINGLEEINMILSHSKLLKEFGLKIIDLSENIINQAGIISKYFYPPSNLKIHQLRAEKLRESYQVEDSNILENRTFRNHIEHFDEKLDKFLKNSIIGDVIPPKSLFQSSVEINSITKVFKAFVIEESKLISLNEEIEIIPLMKEINRIHDLSVEFDKAGRLSWTGFLKIINKKIIIDMKKIILLSVLMIFLSCKKAEDAQVDSVAIEGVQNEIELPEYSLIEEKDISVRTQMEDDAPLNKRILYKYVVSEKIKREQIGLLFNKLIKEKISLDNEIDEITIAFYSNKDIVDGAYDVAIATWMPANGEVTDDIALNNNRESYKIDITIPDNLEEYLANKFIKSNKFGLSEELRKQISIEIGDSEARANKDADKIFPSVNASNQEKYANKLDELIEKYKQEIIKKHNINEDIYFSIMEEGIEKRWE